VGKGCHRLGTDNIHSLDLGGLGFELCKSFDILVDTGPSEAEALTRKLNLLLQGDQLGLCGGNGLIFVPPIFQGTLDLHADVGMSDIWTLSSPNQ
jgi:hypothetical protein